MTVAAITAGVQEIRIRLTEDISDILTIEAQIPLVCGKEDPAFVPGRVVYSGTVPVKDGTAVLPRYCGDFDMLVRDFLCRCEHIPIL